MLYLLSVRLVVELTFVISFSRTASTYTWRLISIFPLKIVPSITSEIRHNKMVCTSNYINACKSEIFKSHFTRYELEITSSLMLVLKFFLNNFVLKNDFFTFHFHFVFIRDLPPIKTF